MSLVAAPGPRRLRVVVVGGGFVGRAAARLAHEAGHDVVVLERRPFSAPVSQAPHAHLLNARGRALVDALFPDLGRALDDAGPPRRDLLWLGPDGAPLGAVADAVVTGLDRAWLDGVVGAWPGDVRFGSSVRALRRVHDHTDVEVQDAAGARSTVPADVVVWASGRGDGALDLCAFAGVAPRVREVKTPLHYRSFGVALEDPGNDDDEQHHDAPPGVLLCSTLGVLRRRGQVVCRVGPGQAIVTQVGEGFAGFEAPSPDDVDAGLLAFATSLQSDAAADVARRWRRTTPVAQLRLGGSRRVTTSTLLSLPPSWLVLGDAAVSLNPIFGQGLALSLEGLALLQPQLLRGRADGRALWRALSPVVDDAWRVATVEDRSTPRSARRGPWPWLVRAATALLVRRLRASPALWRQALAVLTMQARPRSLLSPSLWRAWCGW